MSIQPSGIGPARLAAASWRSSSARLEPNEGDAAPAWPQEGWHCQLPGHLISPASSRDASGALASLPPLLLLLTATARL
jgi:hypothetical protein